jgi:hypothetical protein
MYFLTGEAAGCETEVVLAVVAALQALALRLGMSSYIFVYLAVFFVTTSLFFHSKSKIRLLTI